MTAAEIRDLYLETFARALEPITEIGCCDDHPPIVHGSLTPEDLAAALADAGLLPTEVDDSYVRRSRRRRRRYATPWQDVPE